jgi:hypothetical protein
VPAFPYDVKGADRGRGTRRGSHQHRGHRPADVGATRRRSLRCFGEEDRPRHCP